MNLSPLNSAMSQDGGMIFHILTGTKTQGINQIIFCTKNTPKKLRLSGKKGVRYT